MCTNTQLTESEGNRLYLQIHNLIHLIDCSQSFFGSNVYVAMNEVITRSISIDTFIQGSFKVARKRKIRIVGRKMAPTVLLSAVKY